MLLTRILTLVSACDDDTADSNGDYPDNDSPGCMTSRLVRARKAEERDASVDRAYVASKIAEALAKHDSKMLQITFHLDSTKPVDASKVTDGDLLDIHVKLFEGPKSFSNITIEDPALAVALQLIVVLFYIWLALQILITGPKYIFSLIFMVLAYVAAKTYMGNVDRIPDLLVLPLEIAKTFLMRKVGETAEKAAQSVVRITLKTLFEMANDIQVETQKE